METQEILRRGADSCEKAAEVLAKSGIKEVWEDAGCRVNIVGSLRMGLLASHLDIDLHVYSKGITPESSFAIMAQIARNPAVKEITCINGLETEERCIAWHVKYLAADSELWQFDIIHIEEGSRYDGYFERMADRIAEVMTSEQRTKILELKFASPSEAGWHGVEYYEAVIADGVTTIDELARWVEEHRKKPPYYWIP